MMSVVGCEANVDSLDEKAGEGLGSDGTSGSGWEGADMRVRVCASHGTVKGMDVSYYESSINWAAAKAGGIEFAFIRVSDGLNHKDPKFAPYWAAAKGVGMIRGAYQFFRPGQDPVAQADLLVASLGGVYTPGDLPPTLDAEVTDGLGPTAVAAKITTWMNRVKAKLGVDPIVYTGMYFWRDQVGGLATYKQNALWIAQYTSACPDIPAPWASWTFWQNSGSGHAPGVTGPVDTNFFNGTLDELQALANGTGANNPPPVPPPTDPTTCNSATLDKDVPDGTCVQSANDEQWYACSAGTWVARSSSTGCAAAYGWCASATLGADEPPRTCVQAASDHVWYQCDGHTWVKPVANGAGPAGTCASEHAL
jgi:GH25 family lysozyme M1 (1,4-beta-N-acetylmuramidase)